MTAFRMALVLGLVWSVLGQAGHAQWMFEKRPGVKGSSFEVAAKMPASAQIALGFALKGQLDVLGLARDVRAIAQELDGQAGDFFEIEAELGQTLPQWLAYFTGRGYLAMLKPDSGIDWSDSFVVALQLESPEAFSRWLKSRLGKIVGEREVAGVQIWQMYDGTRFGLGYGWFFFAFSDSTADHLARALAGKGASLADSPTFVRAEKALTGGPSGAFVFVDGKALRETVSTSLEVSSDDPNLKGAEFWDFAVVSMDIAGEQTDAFLGLKPGALNGKVLDLLPGGLSTLTAGDAGWLADVVGSVAREMPPVGLLVGLASAQLTEYGDFGEAFEGTVVVGTNLPEFIAEQLRHDLYYQRPAAEATACGSNLKNIATALEMWSSDNSGDYPEALDTLTPNYLRTVPVCPTQGARPYGYDLVRSQGAPSGYTVVCNGQQHPHLPPDHPRYNSADGLITGEPDSPPADPNRPVRDPLLQGPSISVVVPVRNVSAAHDIMMAAEQANRSYPYQDCSENLRGIGVALEMYAADHEGDYPESLALLTESYYLPSLPTCPAAGRDTYSETYRVGKGEAGAVEVSLFCQGHHHPELDSDRPAWTLSGGLDTGPIRDPEPAQVPAPKVGKQSYRVADGPKGVLDAGARILRLGYGPTADSLLQEPGGAWSEKPSIAQALAWGGESLVYIDYLDAEGSYRTVRSAIDQAAREGEPNARMLGLVLERLRPRLGPLQGVGCLKVSQDGLHYRSRGAASSGQLLGGLFLGGAFLYIPMTESRAAGQLTACKSNMKNIATGLEMWSSDHAGHYPDSLSSLVPDYLKAIPECPAAGADTYSQTYRKYRPDDQAYEGYEFYCQGYHHDGVPGLAADYPRYNSYDGLLEGPGETP